MTAGELREYLKDVADDVDVEVAIRMHLPFAEVPVLTVRAKPYHATNWSDVTSAAGFEIVANAS